MMAAMLLIPMGIFGQTYQQLWKQVKQAQDKDLPQTAIQHLKQIEEKSRKERAYGQLLKAILLTSQLQAEVAPDSLLPAVSRLEEEARQTQDEALKAVYCCVLSKVYEDNSRQLGDEADATAQAYHQQALSKPEVLASVKADSYEPFVIKGKDSKTYYNDDLLSVIGAELDDWQLLHHYYTKAGNRQAACLTGVSAFNDIAALDSLSEVYGDLPEACEIAIKRYGLMDDEHYTPAQKADYLRQSLRKWGSWSRANDLRNSESTLTRPMFQALMPKDVAMPLESQTIKLSSLRNIQQLTIRVYQTPLKGDTKINLNDEKEYKKLKSQLKELPDKSRTLTFASHPDYEFFEDSLELAGLPAGIYLVEFNSPQVATDRELYFVSGVRLLSQPMPEDRTRYVVVDASTGQPITNATLQLSYRSGWKLPAKKVDQACDMQGEVVVTHDDRMPSEVFVYTPSDSYCPSVNGYGRYSYYEREYDNEHTSLFTDRSIYRPGQTVYVSAIVWQEQSVIDNVAKENRVVRMELRDANYKLVAEKSLTTDRFGKCSTEFTLPTGLLNGRFTIRANNSSTSFSVEEYKRPTFQVEFPEYKESYQAGDTVRAQGKAMSYAGVPVQDAKVKYTVKRRVAFWWMSYSWYWGGGYFGRGLQEEVLKEGEAITADDGTFEVEIPMLLPDDNKSARMYYNFVVEADVTDMAGETHNGTMSLPLGTKPTALTCNLPQQVRSDQLPDVTFSRRNAAGKEIAGTVKYRLDGGKWKECAANVQCSIFNVQLKSGEHRLEAICEADSIDMKCVGFGLDDKRRATTNHDW